MTSPCVRVLSTTHSITYKTIENQNRAGCFAFLMSRGCCVTLPRGATGLSAVCDCGISWSYSLTFFLNMHARTNKILSWVKNKHKIRISNHRLAIETGRFSKTPRNERICLHCKTDNFSEIGDEQHLLLKCSRFSEIRIDLFDHVRKSCPRIDTLNDENKFIYLLNSSGSTIKEVAKFLHSAYTARSA